MTYTVHANQGGNVCSAPYTSANIVSFVAAGESYPANCWTRGGTIIDNGNTNDIWVQLPLAAGGVGYVSAVYLSGDERGGLPESADCTEAPPRGETAEPIRRQALTYTVYATREGLVGGTTANGHVIQPNDHFVALPSPRALSPRDSHRYSVRVCNPRTGRCETAPVWDVGPWNVNDDYWNPASQREAWRDLPQGKPEAQAAYQDSYNGGRDGSGRQVSNPAGIDLADGTFSAIGLTENGYVRVTFLWTEGGYTPQAANTAGWVMLLTDTDPAVS